MARGDPYISLADFKAFAGVDVADVRDDAIMTQAIEAASEQCENWTGRFFGQSVAEALVYESCVSYVLDVDDLVSVTEIAIDDGSGAYATVLAPANYRLMPANAPVRKEPYTQVVPVNRVFPLSTWGTSLIRVTGIWGFPVIPDAVKQATMLQANRLYRRVKAPFGVTGATGGSGGELGQLVAITAVDPDFKLLLANWRSLPV